MREIIAVCRSGKKSRLRTAQVLDRYFWRIGDRTWRGKATNACLDRMASELRKRATRNTAVVVHEIRSSMESRMPLIRIGASSSFSDEGIVPVSSHPSSVVQFLDHHQRPRAIVGVAALFHDLGKAMILFQDKLSRALKGGKPEADPVRHELQSATVWDILFGGMSDLDLIDALGSVTLIDIDEACRLSVDILARNHRNPDDYIDLKFLRNEGSIAQAVGLLVLTHHRLPEGNSTHICILASRHVNKDATLNKKDLQIKEGVPFWYEDWWIRRLRREAIKMSNASETSSLDIGLRASLMFADHLGSAAKTVSQTLPDHLANTLPDAEQSKSYVPADSLSQHVKRVYSFTRNTFDMFHKYKDRFPALSQDQAPIDVAFPAESKDPRFVWQSKAAQAARTMCEENEGGFFACILAGTGTGKTRGAPTILANAAFSDSRPERRYMRMSLALGLRVLTTQSAREYVDDLGFNADDVSVLVGQAPIEFSGPETILGSESHISIPEWMRVEKVTGSVPKDGEENESEWITSLSMDTDRGLPAICDLILEVAGKNGISGRRLITPPVMVGTIDHLMAVAAPVNSRYLIQTIRLMTSDLILDEIDQFDGEDIAAIARLVYQTGAAGRRVIIMSATLTTDIAEALHSAYSKGWKSFSKASGISSNVNLLITGDALGSCFTSVDCEDVIDAIEKCCAVTLDTLSKTPALRRGEILPHRETWQDLVAQVDDNCTRSHRYHHAKVSGHAVSVGLVRMTRIAHTAAMSVQLPSGLLKDRLRLVLCLHSNFPRLHRGWIETQLKRALTRKGDDPEAGLRSLCETEGVFERAKALGVTDIEIVVVTSPVIETGNDLDFDYAIIDPISMRSIVQSAGRVQRHRPVCGQEPNILIMGKSPIAMEQGLLSNPGVETSPHFETTVKKMSLAKFEDRLIADLAGDETFYKIDAASIISGIGTVPLRDAERDLRSAMINLSEDSPLGLYLNETLARLNLQMTKTRKFRRSTTRDIHYFMDGEGLRDATWFVDFAPGTHESEACVAQDRGLSVAALENEDHHLFRTLTRSAWHDLSGGSLDMSSEDMKNLMTCNVSDFSRDIDTQMTYAPFTGFTRGSYEDLFLSYGKVE